jgi:hypothetical protein
MAPTTFSPSAQTAPHSSPPSWRPLIVKERTPVPDVREGFLRSQVLPKVMALGDYGLLWLAYLLGQGRIH